MNKGVKATLITLVSVLAVVIVGIIGYFLYPAIKGTITGSRYYTAADMESARNEAYANGNKSQQEMLQQIEYYKELMDEYKTEMNQLSTALSNAQQQTSVDAAQLNDIRNRLTQLSNDYSNAQAQISNLQHRNEDLMQTIDACEEFIANLGLTTTYTVKFYYCGEPYHSTIVFANESAIVTDPVSTDYVHFNGWTVNGGAVDVSAYPITQDTVFVASVSYSYDVTFMYDDQVYQKIIVDENGIAAIDNPIDTERIKFNGWMVDGVIVDPSTYRITANTVFTAAITKYYLVTYQSGGFNIKSVYVEAGATVDAAEVLVDNEGKRVTTWKRRDNFSTFENPIVITEDTVLSPGAVIIGSTDDIHMFPHEPTPSN